MKLKLLAVLAAIGLCTQAAAQAGARYGGATAIERAQLPKYCYALHVDSKYLGHPEYDIPRSCGIFMNHYCQGLIYLLRAQKAALPIRARKDNAGAAVTIIRGSLKDMGPQCPIRADAEAALAMARAIQANLK